jgi:hypothetical protein
MNNGNESIKPLQEINQIPAEDESSPYRRNQIRTKDKSHTCRR